MSGPLSGIRIVEFAGLGPAPFAGMMLADHGAEVILVDRPGTPHAPHDILRRSRRSIALNLKHPGAHAVLHRLIASADGLIEGFRPGVMERLGLGPDVLLPAFPRLVFGRMTGWGQDGPLAHAAGHDINYISLPGNLHGYGRAGGKPTPPTNAVGDFGGGGMMLAFGMVAALLAVRGGTPGQVIDCAMVDGAAVLAAMTWGFRNAGSWTDERGTNLLDSGAPFYDSYETADGKWISIGPLEPQFYAEFRRLAEVSADPTFDDPYDRARWPRLRDAFTALFRTRTRAQWCALLEGTDACFAPILSLDEAPDHPHLAARGSFIRVDGAVQPAPAPRYSGFPPDAPRAPAMPGADGPAVLGALGYADDEIAALRQDGVLA